MRSFAFVLVTVLLPGTSVGHPGHFGLVPPDEMKTAERRPLAPEDIKDLRTRLVGSWKIAGYRLWNAGAYMEVPVRKEKIDETRESWMFRENGQFRHQMSAHLWFTGSWEIVDALWRPGVTDEGTSRGYVILRTFGVATSMMTTRKEEFFLLTYLDDWKSVCLFYLGKDSTDLKGLRQGHAFLRAPYGQN